MSLHQQLDELIHRVLPVVQDFHGKGLFAPHAATIDSAGQLSGHALTADGTTQQRSVLQAIQHFENTFVQQAKSGDTHATGIFYHSPGMTFAADSIALPPASTTDECNTLVALLEHVSGDSVYLLIPYSGQPPNVAYSVGTLIEKPVKVFSSKPPPPSPV